MLLSVITISDRCSQGLMTDTAGPAVAALLLNQWPDADLRIALLPDDEDDCRDLINDDYQLKSDIATLEHFTGKKIQPEDEISVSDDEKGALIGKYQRRGDATKVVAMSAYQPEPKW